MYIDIWPISSFITDKKGWNYLQCWTQNNELNDSSNNIGYIISHGKKMYILQTLYLYFNRIVYVKDYCNKY